MAHDVRYIGTRTVRCAQLQAVGCIGQVHVQYPPYSLWVIHLRAGSRPGRPPRPLPLLVAEARGKTVG